MVMLYIISASKAASALEAPAHARSPLALLPVLAVVAQTSDLCGRLLAKRRARSLDHTEVRRGWL